MLQKVFVHYIKLVIGCTLIFCILLPRILVQLIVNITSMNKTKCLKLIFHTFLTADLGGVFGVCLGGSFLTLMEAIEFLIVELTRRLCKSKEVAKETPVKAIVAED